MTATISEPDERVWTVDWIPAAAPTADVSLAVDQRRRPVVAYWVGQGTPDSRLMVARRDDTSWQIDDVVAAHGAFSALLVDEVGEPLVAFVDLEEDAVKLARPAPGGGFDVSAVAGPLSGFASTGPALGRGPGGAVAVCLASDAGLVLADGPVVDPDTPSGVDVSIAFDAASGLGHLLCRDPLANALVHYRQNGSGWARSEIGWLGGRDSGQLGDRPSIAVDRTGRPHVAYGTDHGLRYAVAEDGGGWSTESADAEPGAGSAPVIRLDREGRPIIGSFHLGTGQIHVHWKDEDGWHRDDIAVSGPKRSLGGTVGLALDHLDVPHLAFVDDATGAVGVSRLNRPPLAPILRYHTFVNTDLVGTDRLAPDRVVTVLPAPTDRDGDLLRAEPGPEGPSNGTLMQLRPNGRFRYQPAVGFNGPDSFQYEITDPYGLSAVGDVEITVAIGDLIAVDRIPLPRRVHASRVSVDLRPRGLARFNGYLQRRVGDAWEDVRVQRADQLHRVVRPRPQDWEEGPYRLELRRRDQRHDYVLVRSVPFDYPPRTGYLLRFSGDLTMMRLDAGSPLGPQRGRPPPGGPPRGGRPPAGGRPPSRRPPGSGPPSRRPPDRSRSPTGPPSGGTPRSSGPRRPPRRPDPTRRPPRGRRG